METITIRFSGNDSGTLPSNPTLILIKDENGIKGCLETIFEPKQTIDVTEDLTKRVIDAITERDVDKILSKDVIECDVHVLDGWSYEITISKGSVTKEYDANSVSIFVYPLLRNIAKWYEIRFKGRTL